MTAFEQFCGRPYKHIVIVVPGCCLRPDCTLLEAMKSIVGRVEHAYGATKAFQGACGFHWWKAGAGTSDCNFSHWHSQTFKAAIARATSKHQPICSFFHHHLSKSVTQKCYHAIDRSSSRIQMYNYHVINQWPVALSLEILVVMFAHDSTCQRWRSKVLKLCAEPSEERLPGLTLLWCLTALDSRDTKRLFVDIWSEGSPQRRRVCVLPSTEVPAF